MKKRDFAFEKTNFILIAIGVIIAIVGIVLMTGGSSTEESYNPDVFSTLRIKVAPFVTFVGFVSIIFAILYHSRKDEK